MNTNGEELTPAEQQYLERAKAAESQGMRLAQHYRANGLSLYSLYDVRRRVSRRRLVSCTATHSRKGIRPRSFRPS